MSKAVSLHDRVIHKRVFELRYEFGQVYWDRAGRIAKQILSDDEEMDFDTIDVNRCQISNRAKNLVLSFGHNKLDLSQTQNADVDQLVPFGEFGAIADRVTRTVVEALELETFSRSGFREWRLFPSHDREESHDAVKQLEMFHATQGLVAKLGDVSEMSFRVVVARDDHMLRAAVSPFEQDVNLPPSVIRAAKVKAHAKPKNQRQILIDKLKAEKRINHYPQFGVLVDFDAYVEDPIFDEPSVSDFVASASMDFDKVEKIVLMSS